MNNDTINQFFYEFTLKICSSLHIEVAMTRVMTLLASYMPADEMYLCLFDYTDNTFKVLSKATKKDGVTLNQNQPLTQAALHSIRSLDRSKVSVINRIEDDPVVASMFAERMYETRSCLLLPLTIEGHIVCMVQLYAGGENRYTTADAELLSIISRPFSIAVSNSLEHIQLTQLKNRLNEENINLKRQLQHDLNIDVVGKNNGLSEVFEMAQLVAPLNSPVLILGETGTGKEVIANAIYNASARSEGPYVKVNCGAIPSSLLDSELFGHEKGSFTGAISKKIGRFERANLGTIFLDEIGELPLEAQVRLLRVIQEKEIERVGGTEAIPLDIRIICATHRDLTRMIEDGGFREDLFFRINVFPIFIPPLRHRTEDIPLLIDYFIKKKSIEIGLRKLPKIRTEDIEILKQYHWPGNIRELQNIIERSIILCKKDTLTFEKILPELYGHTFKSSVPHTNSFIANESLDESLSVLIRNALEKTNGRISGPQGAASCLNINPSTLRSRMLKLGIEDTFKTKN